MTDPSVTERWLPVVGYKGFYEASNFGRIKGIGRYIKHPCGGRSFLKEHVLKSWIGPRGYKRVSLGMNGIQKKLLVHRLVLEAFSGPCPDGMECCHYDGDRTNSKLENLRWDTRKNNHADKIRHGTTSHGPKLTTETVKQIRILYELSDLTQSEMAKMYGVATGTITAVCTRTTWAWVSQH